MEFSDHGAPSVPIPLLLHAPEHFHLHASTARMSHPGLLSVENDESGLVPLVLWHLKNFWQVYNNCYLTLRFIVFFFLIYSSDRKRSFH